MSKKPRYLTANERAALIISIVFLASLLGFLLGREALYACGKGLIKRDRIDSAEWVFSVMDGYRNADIYEGYCGAVREYDPNDHYTASIAVVYTKGQTFSDDAPLLNGEVILPKVVELYNEVYERSEVHNMLFALEIAGEPYVGLSVEYINDSALGEADEIERNYERWSVEGESVLCDKYTFYTDERHSVEVMVGRGEVIHVLHRTLIPLTDNAETEPEPPAPSSNAGSSVSGSIDYDGYTPSGDYGSSGGYSWDEPEEDDDPYGAGDYSSAEDFYYDYYDDFWDYEDAEEYFNEHQ